MWDTRAADTPEREPWRPASAITSPDHEEVRGTAGKPAMASPTAITSGNHRRMRQAIRVAEIEPTDTPHATRLRGTQRPPNGPETSRSVPPLPSGKHRRVRHAGRYGSWRSSPTDKSPAHRLHAGRHGPPNGRKPSMASHTQLTVTSDKGRTRGMAADASGDHGRGTPGGTMRVVQVVADGRDPPHRLGQVVG